MFNEDSISIFYDATTNFQFCVLKQEKNRSYNCTERKKYFLCYSS